MQFITYFKNALTLPTHGSKLFLLSFILLFSSFLSTAFSAEETEQILLDLRNIIHEQNGQEQNKVKSIGIFCYKDERITPWDPDSIHSGIAGSEEAVIYLSQELAKLGCQVTVFAQPPSASPHSLPEANPRYVAADYAPNNKLDVAIAWRMSWNCQNLKQMANKVYFWPHDTPSGSKDERDILAFDDVLWLSNWQRAAWINYAPAWEKFTKVFGNGIVPEQFNPIQERKNPYACIWGSNYARGLEQLLAIWPQVKKSFPEATLDIYYGWQTWGLLSPEQELIMRSQIEQYASLGVREHGKVSHDELSRAYENASFWTYPCTLPETFCISALRAQLAGAVPVIIEGSALTESVKSGYRCKTVDEYLSTLLQAMKNADSISLQQRSEMGNFVLDNFTWKKIAEKWLTLFNEDTSCFQPNLPMLENNGTYWPRNSRFLVIIHHFGGDVTWASQLNYPHIIYEKNKPENEPFNAINKAEGEANLLKFIAQFYDNLPDNIIQVYQYEYNNDHKGSLVDIINAPDFQKTYDTSKTSGFLNFNSVNMGDISERIPYMIESGWWTNTMKPWFGDIVEYGNFTQGKRLGTQFVVSKERIKSLPREFYVNMYDWLVKNSIDNVKASDYMRSSWELIFTSYKPNDRIGALFLGEGNDSDKKEFKKEAFITALYGAKKYYRDVTPQLIIYFLKDKKIIIPQDADLNAAFTNVVHDSEKTLLLNINEKTYEIPEKRTSEVILDLKS